MARKSRKPTLQSEPDKGTKPKYRVGVYTRESSGNMQLPGSESLETQKAIILEYIKTHPELELTDIYEDRNQSGTSYQRPEFLRLAGDLEKGRINCIITKDLSRLGRNHLETGRLLEQVFPSMGVRVIALGEYDSEERAGAGTDISVQLRNLVNEFYAIETGRKIRATLEVKHQLGQWHGRPPYGYRLREKRLIVDEKEAASVKMAYNLILEGKTEGFIRRQLETCQGRLWSKTSVGRMLRNRVYAGCTIYNKSVKRMTEKGKSVYVTLPPEQWTVFEGTHDAIVDREVFERAQKILDGRRRERLGAPASGAEAYQDDK